MFEGLQPTNVRYASSDNNAMPDCYFFRMFNSSNYPSTFQNKSKAKIPH